MPPLPLEGIARAICVARGLSFVDAVGAGAFKETYHVQLPDGTSLALKVYKPGAASPERTQREIDAMVRCAHPNIGQLMEISSFSYTGQNFLYSLEEFLSGGSLADRLRVGLLPPDEVYALGMQLIDALVHIAALDLVHRDLKPDNIMLRGDGVTPVVVDFGLVRDLAETSLTHSWLMRGPGTPFYAPAEQLNNEKAAIDWRADQFSLGILLSVGAFGFHPYLEPGDVAAQAVNRVSQRGAQAARFRDAALASGLPVLIKMTAAWPVQRYRKPTELQVAWLSQRGQS